MSKIVKGVQGSIHMKEFGRGWEYERFEVWRWLPGGDEFARCKQQAHKLMGIDAPYEIRVVFNEPRPVSGRLPVSVAWYSNGSSSDFSRDTFKYDLERRLFRLTGLYT